MIPFRVRVDIFIRKYPFLLLARHFASRTTGLNSTSDLDFGLGGMLALLALPGAFSAIMLMDKYSSLLQFLRGQRHFNPYVACLPDEYFFIIYSMAITGLITLLRWDQLLPDARDFANLASLSISLRKIFLANVMALAALAALFAVDINLVSALVFPLLVTIQADNAGAVVEVLGAHALATIGISAFTFLAVVAMQGLLMAALPGRLYRKVALLCRTALLILLTGTLISVFVVSLPFLQVSYLALRGAHWWPPLWFLSLFESHITALHMRASLGASFAWRGLAGAFLLTLGGFSLSYKRYFLKIPERQTSLTQPNWLPFHSTLAVFRPLLAPGFETACFQFIFRTMVRSETHLLFAGLFSGIGLLLSFQESKQTSAPLIFALFSLGGIRFAFDIASTTNANWAFRLIASSDEMSLVRGACRKLLLFAGLPPLILIWFPFFTQQTSLYNAAIYLWFHVLSISILVELLLWKFRKVPFTCALIPQRDRFLKILIGTLILLLLGFPALEKTEAAVMEYPALLPIFIGVLMTALIWLCRRRTDESEVLLFQDAGQEAFVLLRLGSE